ncbi:hypothetical protein BH09PAT4_BH09PAT4_00020 [soil metagenome]
MALPKYKEVKRIIEKSVSKRFRDVSRVELRPFNESPSFVQHEGKTLIHNTLDNQDSKKTMNYQMAHVEYKLEHAKIPDMTPEEVFAIIDEKAKEMGGQMAKYHFEVLNKTIEETGNNIDAKGKKLSPDLFLETMSKLSIAFDKEGNPKLPTIVISPKTAAHWKRVMAEAEADPKHKEKFDAIIAQKKKEFDAEQARRKLVD